MEEKRKEKRIPIGFNLSVSDLYQENPYALKDISSSIDVTDISAKGIGFICETVLPVGYIFIANIELYRDMPQIITDVKIIRSLAIDKTHYQYGCEFVSISPKVSKMLDDFEARLKENGESFIEK